VVSRQRDSWTTGAEGTARLALWRRVGVKLRRFGGTNRLGKRGIERPAIAEQLMEEVCGREN